MKRVLEIALDGEGTFGGGSKHLIQLLEGLDSHRYQTDAVVWEIPQLTQYLEDHDVNFIAVKSRHILDAGLVQRLARHIQSGEYDLIHTHGHRAGFIGRLAAMRARAPRMIWTLHQANNKADRNPLMARAYNSSLRTLDRRTDATIAVSKHLKQWLVARGIAPDHVRVVYNCVDLQEFHPRDPSVQVIDSLGLHTDPSRPIVGAIARLTPDKHLETFIEAVAPVLTGRPDAQFVIVGGGPLREDLAGLAARLGVTDRIVFAGERDHIPDILATFDIALLSSRTEGFSYVPLEVMASRKPLICSNIPPFMELVTDGETGKIFPVGDTEGLARAILELLNNRAEAQRLAEAGYDYVNRDFSLHVMLDRTMAVYEEVLSRPATAS